MTKKKNKAIIPIDTEDRKFTSFLAQVKVYMNLLTSRLLHFNGDQNIMTHESTKRFILASFESKLLDDYCVYCVKLDISEWNSKYLLGEMQMDELHLRDLCGITKYIKELDPKCKAGILYGKLLIFSKNEIEDFANLMSGFMHLQAVPNAKYAIVVTPVIYADDYNSFISRLEFGIRSVEEVTNNTKRVCRLMPVPKKN